MSNKTRSEEYAGIFHEGLEAFSDLPDPRTGRNKHLHILSAWACEDSLSLGQLEVDAKSNEIKALPEFIDLLDLEGHTVRLDAMGSQKTIAKNLYINQADYLLALKANHGYFKLLLTKIN